MLDKIRSSARLTPDSTFQTHLHQLMKPHRGTLILVLGILGLVVCGPLGIAAWVMGNTDLERMRRGEMDRSGEGTTKAGRTCGIIAVVLMCISLVAVLIVAGAA